MMAENVKLYDLRKNDYPSKRGDEFRSVQVFECPICHALTNKIVTGGRPVYGIRAICPHSRDRWHHLLERKIEWLQHPHPQAYKVELEKEISALRDTYADCVTNDLVGEADMSQKSAVTNTRSFLLQDDGSTAST